MVELFLTRCEKGKFNGRILKKKHSEKWEKCKLRQQQKISYTTIFKPVKFTALLYLNITHTIKHTHSHLHLRALYN
jgi:hypothetical protein